jgi:hypothetical protein
MTGTSEYDWNVNAVGAMDVSVKRSAAEFDANVIARSDDLAMTTVHCAEAHFMMRLCKVVIAFCLNPSASSYDSWLLPPSGLSWLRW